jgi:hypothetical protein
LRHGRHFHEIKITFTGNVKGFGQRLYAELLALFIDKTDFPSTDTFIDPGLVRCRCTGYAASLLNGSSGGIDQKLELDGTTVQHPPTKNPSTGRRRGV